MIIKKIGHCCLLIKTNGVTVLTDPGSFTTTQDEIDGIDLVVISHEHGDHLHIDSLKRILVRNPEAQVVSNTSVGKILAQEGMPHTVLDGTAITNVAGIQLQAFDCKHEEIFEEFGQVQNTGYMIDKRLCYPGDSFGNPGVAVDILALPVAGPWCKIADALRYAIALNPKHAFPVHDAMIRPDTLPFMHSLPGKILGARGIDFRGMLVDSEEEF